MTSSAKQRHDRYIRLRAAGLCVTCKRLAEVNKAKCQSCVDRNMTYSRKLKARLHQRLSRAKIKSDIINAYGGKCICCAESNINYLIMDHVYNDGSQHRREVGMGSAMYRWIRDNKFPSSFQILCANCHLAKGLKVECHNNHLYLNSPAV